MNTDDHKENEIPDQTGRDDSRGKSPAAALTNGQNDLHLPAPTPQKRTPRLVQRRTGLRGLSIGAAPVPDGTIRKRTMAQLNERDPEIPYLKFEKVLRDLVCSLMERQDRMNEELLRRMIDLQYRVDDMEFELAAIKKAGS